MAHSRYLIFSSSGRLSASRSPIVLPVVVYTQLSPTPTHPKSRFLGGSKSRRLYLLRIRSKATRVTLQLRLYIYRLHSITRLNIALWGRRSAVRSVSSDTLLALQLPITFK